MAPRVHGARSVSATLTEVPAPGDGEFEGARRQATTNSREIRRQATTNSREFADTLTGRAFERRLSGGFRKKFRGFRGPGALTRARLVW
jgi:hypothetical protein